MKSLVVYENNLEQLKYVDGVIMPLLGYSVSYANKYTLDEISEFVLSNKEKEVFVVVNRNLFNEDISSLEDVLVELDNIGITGLFYYDLSVLSIYRRHNFKFQLIWNQTHMVTNYNTINYYLKRGVSGAVLSNEITLNEILEIRNNTFAKLFVNVVFCPIMSFSRRKLLSNYCKSMNIDVKSSKLEIMEHSNGYKCFVLEEDDGTSIYSSKLVNNLDVVETYIKNNIDYIIIDTSFIDDGAKEKSLYTAYSIINNLEIRHKLVREMKNEIGGNTGFLYRKTIYKVK